MRNRGVRAGIATWPFVLLVGGCTGTLEDTEPSYTRIELVGVEDRFVLLGTPMDEAYKAFYPNPDGLERMWVTLKRGAKLEIECGDPMNAGAESTRTRFPYRTDPRLGSEESDDCADSPFFIDVDEARRGFIHAKIFDMYGELIAREDVASTSVDATICEPYDEFCDPNQNEPGLPGPSLCERPELKKRFCDGVNEELERRGADYRLDCTALPDEFALDDPPTRPRDPLVRRCEDILEPVEEPLEEEVDRLDDECGERKIRTWKENTRYKLIKGGVCQISPIVLDLDGDGVELSSPSDGARFDLAADGSPVMAAWPLDDDAFLVIDENGNGRIDDATELFGNASFGKGFADGFEALSTLDANGDGTVDRRDPRFVELRLWNDTDRDGRSTPDELRALEAHGVARLETSPNRRDGVHDRHGNDLSLTGRFETGRDEAGLMIDAFLRFQVDPNEPFELHQ